MKVTPQIYCILCTRRWVTDHVTLHRGSTALPLGLCAACRTGQYPSSLSATAWASSGKPGSEPAAENYAPVRKWDETWQAAKQNVSLLESPKPRSNQSQTQTHKAFLRHSPFQAKRKSITKIKMSQPLPYSSWIKLVPKKVIYLFKVKIIGSELTY